MKGYDFVSITNDVINQKKLWIIFIVFQNTFVKYC